VAIFSFVLSFILSFPTAQLARLCGAIDTPDGVRKLQKDGVVRFGGISIYVSAALTIIFWGIPEFISGILLIGGGAILLFGAFDDVFEYSAAKKLAAELIVAVSSAAAILSRDNEKAFLPYFLIYTFFIVFLINSFNIIDGTDGLCSSLALVAFFVLGVRFNIAYALFFSVLGFLPRNIPAKMYLGESGAAFIGYSIAVMLLYLNEARYYSSVILPVAEVISTVIRRTVSGKSPFSADRVHVHHVLYDSGYSTHKIALLYTVLSLTITLGVAAVQP
jgi:UDP-GlcNAc:undecaprenyl-phosphate GlcNAc-1-phosphate transferase